MGPSLERHIEWFCGYVNYVVKFSLYTLTCTVSSPQQHRDTPTIQWTTSNGTVIENDIKFLLDVTPSPLVVVLTFAPLRVSHGGVYIQVCG